jgi:hypothetical protein
MCFIGENILDHWLPKPEVARSIRAGGILKGPKFAEFRGFGLSHLPENFKKRVKFSQGKRAHSTYIAHINILNWENVNIAFRPWPGGY